MTDPKPFPEDDAKAVKDAASYLDTVTDVVGAVAAVQTLPLAGVGGAAVVAKATWSANVDNLLKGIKTLLGDYTAAHDLSLSWATLANTPIDIRDHLRDQMKGQVDDYWQGKAFDSFSSHMDNINEALKDTSTKLNTMSKSLANAIGLVIDTWGSAVGYISKCAITVAGVLDPSAIIDAIKKLANDTADLIEKAIKTMGGYKKDITALEDDAVSFPTLPEDPKTLDSAGNSDGWDVRKA